MVRCKAKHPDLVAHATFRPALFAGVYKGQHMLRILIGDLTSCASTPSALRG